MCESTTYVHGKIVSVSGKTDDVVRDRVFGGEEPNFEENSEENNHVF